MFVPISSPRIVYLYTCQTQSMEVPVVHVDLR